MNWKITLFKSLFILIWLWGSLFIWAVIGGILIGILITILQNFNPHIDSYPINLTLFNFGFFVTHLLSIIGLSGYIKEEEGKIIPGRM